MSETQTRERLIDAAEELIGTQGYHNTSLRQITQLAEANVAAVNYHFGSKEGLVEAVIKRRLTPLDRIRLAKLDDVRQAAQESGERLSAGKVLNAFIEPTLHFVTTVKGGRHFLRIIGRAHTEPDGTIKRIFLKTIRPTLMRFFQSLCESQPDLPHHVVFFRMMFTIGAMAHAAHVMTDENIIDEFQLGLDSSEGVQFLQDELLGYVSRGMEG